MPDDAHQAVERTADAVPLSPRTRKIAVGLLVIVGVQFWLVLGRSDWGQWFQRYLLVAALVLAIIPPVGRGFLWLLDCIRHPSRRSRAVAAVCIAIFSSCFLVYTAWYQDRNFRPKWQDEMSYIIQFRMMAQGRLWYPKHELADFFDSFQLIVDPVYASMYFPGSGLLYAPAQFLGLPFWAMAAIAGGITVALVYLVISEALDGVAGALSVLMMLGLFQFRKLAIMIGGHPPMLVAELALIYCYFRWTDSQRARSRGAPAPIGWALAMGAVAGWGAIIRPLDALVVALPVGIMMIRDLFARPPRAWLVTGACLVGAAAPFLALQLIFNLGVTGTWPRTPFDHYADRDYPLTRLGFHEFDPTVRPVSQLPQKQKYYDDFAVPAIKRHQPEKLIGNWLGRTNERGERETGDLIRALADGMPQRMMMALLPAGLLGLFARKRLVIWMILPMYVVGFSFYTWNLPHYAIITAPAVILWVLCGARVIETTWPKLRPMLATFLTLSIAILSVTETPQLNRLTIPDELFDPQGLRNVDEALRNLDRTPAVVLFRWHPRLVGDEEPVYNTETAWPDDARIIRAHDLGERNIEIFRYYAKRQPDRAFYLYDRGDDSIRYLGTARQLARGATDGG